MGRASTNMSESFSYDNLTSNAAAKTNTKAPVSKKFAPSRYEKTFLSPLSPPVSPTPIGLLRAESSLCLSALPDCCSLSNLLIYPDLRASVFMSTNSSCGSNRSGAPSTNSSPSSLRIALSLLSLGESFPSIASACLA